MVFIDQDGTATGTTTQVIGTYREYGPKNEVYLAQGQSIAFKVSDVTANYYLGIKAPNGETIATVTWGENAATLPVNAASDLILPGNAQCQWLHPGEKHRRKPAVCHQAPYDQWK